MFGGKPGGAAEGRQVHTGPSVRPPRLDHTAHSLCSRNARKESQIKIINISKAVKVRNPSGKRQEQPRGILHSEREKGGRFSESNLMNILCETPTHYPQVVSVWSGRIGK